MRYTPLILRDVLSTYIDVIASTKNFLSRFKVESCQQALYALHRPCRIILFCFAALVGSIYGKFDQMRIINGNLNKNSFKNMSIFIVKTC